MQKGFGLQLSDPLLSFEFSSCLTTFISKLGATNIELLMVGDANYLFNLNSILFLKNSILFL